MHRISLLLASAFMVLCAGPLHAQFITNGTLNIDASGWSLGGGCGDEAWDGSAGNPPGSIRLNACGESSSDPAAAQTIMPRASSQRLWLLPVEKQSSLIPLAYQEHPALVTDG
jgi:hypothetical protein